MQEIVSRVVCYISLMSAEMGEREITPRDSLARFLSISSLVLAFCVFVAVLVLAPLTLLRLWDQSDRMFEKLDAERFFELQAKVNEMEHKIILLEVAQTNARTGEELKPVLFRVENETTTRSLPNLEVAAKYKREVKDSGDYPSTGGATVYTRWGHSECPSTSGTSLVYEGVIGVASASQPGGGCNHQCLPSEPEFGYTKPGLQYSAGEGGTLLTGVEYKMDNIYPFDNGQNHGNSLNNEDAVCSVCFVEERSVTIMIPAQRKCPKGWTLEYRGYLMASGRTNHRVDYICVDEAPNAKESGEKTAGGSFLKPVEGTCGALPCPNYSEGFELACVVCTH